MRALADELGVSAMTPYRYVDNKDGLLALVRTEAFRRLADSQEAAARACKVAAHRLLALKRAYVAFALEEPDAYRIMFELRQLPATSWPALEEQSRRAFAPLNKATREAIGLGLM